MRALLMFWLTVWGKATKTVSENHTFLRAEIESNQGPLAYQPNALPLEREKNKIWNKNDY